MLAYRIELEEDDNGTFLATCPALPEVTTFGEDRGEARLRALDAIEEALAARIAHRMDIPASREGRLDEWDVVLPVQTGIKVALYREMRRSGLNKADLARLLAAHAPQVDRLLDLRHDSKLEKLEQAFRALGKQIDLTIVNRGA